MKSLLFDDASYKHNLTMVILGETGVGKSTWINSFCNYVQLISFNDAISETKKLYVPIYTKFNYKKSKAKQEVSESEDDDDDQEEEFEDVLIQLGRCDNPEEMNLSTVKSATKVPCSYSLTQEDTTITLVDTPGIADNTYTGEQAKEEDDKNINNILEHISTFQTINAFVILLNPGEKRLDERLRYCIKKLFSQLHTSALQNIVFAFTHAKNTDFKPGETVDVLKELFKEINIDFKISKKNMFFFDNSPFRYLAVRGRGFQPTEQEWMMREFWEKSVQQGLKLIKYVKKLHPHDSASTMSVQTARMSIHLMTKPLLEICKDINQSRNRLLVILDEVDDEIKGEGKQRYRTAIGVTMKYKELKSPQTVCTNPQCCKDGTLALSDGTESRKKLYNPICCQNCWLPFVALESKGSWNLKFCSAFPLLSNQCKICKHLLSEHIHIRYVLEHISHEITGTIDELRQRYSTLESEYNIIVATMGFFTYYQRNNIITTFHDSITAHLDDEIQRVQLGRDSLDYEGEKEKFQTLVELKTRYEMEYERLDGCCEEPPTPQVIEKLLEEIFALEIKGQELKEVYEAQKKQVRMYQENNKNATKLFDLTSKDGGFPKVTIKNANLINKIPSIWSQ